LFRSDVQDYATYALWKIRERTTKLDSVSTVGKQAKHARRESTY